MKTVLRLLVALTLLAWPSMVQAQVSGFVEVWNTVKNDTVVPQVNISLNAPVKGDFGWTTWAIASKSWSEATLGLTYTPVKGLEFSGSVGLESGAESDNTFRSGASVFVSKGRFSFLSIREEGIDHWYRHLATIQLSKTVAIGYQDLRFFGRGPYVEKKVGPLVLWGAISMNQQKGIVTARLTF